MYVCVCGLIKKAYDSVHQQNLFNKLKEYNFPNKLLNITEATLKNTEIIKIKVVSEVSGLAVINTSLKQGDALLPVLCINSNNGIVLVNSNINILAYADDIAI